MQAAAAFFAAQTARAGLPAANGTGGLAKANAGQPRHDRPGLNPDAPISTFVKRLRSSECGSGSVMAKRTMQSIPEQGRRKRRA